VFHTSASDDSRLEIDDLGEALPVWAAAAGDDDQLDLALALLDEADVPDQSTALILVRARLLLLGRRPGEALDLLRTHEIAGVSGAKQATWADLVFSACLAACGDQNAYRWLLQEASPFADGEDGWRVAYLVATAAAQIGDTAVADQAWRRLAMSHGIVTGMTLAEFTATELATRDRTDVHAAVRTVSVAAGNFRHLPLELTHDLSPLTLAVRRLIDRGDAPGARLLVTAIVKRQARHPVLDQALDRLTPQPDMRRYRTKVLVLGGLSLTLVPLGIIGFLVIFAGYRFWTTRVQVPGFDRTDSRIWRAFNSLRHDPATATTKGPRGELNGPRIAAGVVGITTGVYLATEAVAGAAHLSGAAQVSQANPILVISLWLLVWIATVIGSIAGVEKARTLKGELQRRRERNAAERRTEVLADQCQCWQTRLLRGSFADAYRSRHLVPVASGSGVEHLRQRLGAGVSVGRCLTTGAIWLAGPLGPGNTQLLLRGPAPVRQLEPPVAPSQSGFYM
jgi:hypothetical protein